LFISHQQFEKLSLKGKRLRTMKRIPSCALLLAIIGLFAGCASYPPNAERGPQGTIAYYVQIESSDPGVRIEANNDYIGKSPCTLKIFGDRDGTFHNFGSYEYIIRAFPLNTNEYIQTKVFRTGGWFSQEDKIPTHIYFDMNEKTSGFSVELPPRY
jgi:hypothetical protein